MSKTLETKRRILELLKKRNMTITELSRELGLTTATISQHMDELQNTGAVEKIDSEHFKKLKYYRVAQPMNPSIAKYVIGAIIVFALIVAILLHNSSPTTNSYTTTSANTATPGTSITPAGNTTQPTPPTGGGTGAAACPLITYELNGTITGYNGFTLYTINSSNYGSISDYVIAPGTNGSMNIAEMVSSMIQQPSGTNASEFTTNRTHYVFISNLNQSFNVTGINATATPSTYNVVSQGQWINFTVNYSVSPSANQATYWVRIDGPCNGGVNEFLFTIGTAPYSGNIPTQTGIYS
jgi:DNA-binding transcriptional ArsR family regulator